MSTLRVNNLTDTSGTAANLGIPGAAKAWVNFDGTGTVSIRSSYNVSSITDEGTGRYTINFTNAFTDTNYAECFAFSGDSNGGNLIRSYLGASEINKTTSSIQIQSLKAQDNNIADCAAITGSFFSN